MAGFGHCRRKAPRSAQSFPARRKNFLLLCKNSLLSPLEFPAFRTFEMAVGASLRRRPLCIGAAAAHGRAPGFLRLQARPCGENPGGDTQLHVVQLMNISDFLPCYLPVSTLLSPCSVSRRSLLFRPLASPCITGVASTRLSFDGSRLRLWPQSTTTARQAQAKVWAF